MEINFTCLHCSNPVEIDDSAAGMEVECPHCEEPLIVPEAGAAANPDAADFLEFAASSEPLPPMFDDADFEILESCVSSDGAVVEIIQYKTLNGAANIVAAKNLFYAERSNMRLKMVRIRMNKHHVRVEPGALYFMKGHLQMKASTGGGVFKAVSRKMLSGESFFVNQIHGVGEIYLEPTFGHFLLKEISEADEALIVDRGMFYAGTAGLDITAQSQKNISSALFGGEGFFQTKIKGSGVAVLYSPVPRNEIQELELRGDKLWVDGNFALARTEGVIFRVEKSSKGWLSTAVSGEGLLQSFEGVGKVWIAPTQGIYQRLSTSGGLSTLSRMMNSSGTDTDD
jgi:uncharacterized protein (AIM24 family)/DNA-directed RNA polymerase subunit RPC12/RpoP